MFFDEEKELIDQEAHEATSQIVQPSAAEESFKDQYLRLNADFQNFKRRVEKERIEWATSAQSAVLKKLLPLFDELDSVVMLAQGQTTDNANWTKGLELSQKNWQKALVELGVEEIPTGGMFDPELHEGLMQEEADDKESGSVLRTFSKGYRFKGLVIRHAKVSVVK